MAILVAFDSNNVATWSHFHFYLSDTQASVGDFALMAL
jgi:hypothetical protein